MPVNGAENAPRSGLVWNAGGWFGAQFGYTLWLLIGAVYAAAHRATIAAGVLLGAFVIVNAVGVWLWSRRARGSYVRSSQGMMIVTGVAATLALAALDGAGLLTQLAPAGPLAGRRAYWLLLIFPIMLAVFEWKARR